MSKFNNYTVIDFVQDPSFRRWVLKKPLQEDVFWDNWYKENIAKQPLIDEASSLIIGLQIPEDQPDVDEIKSAIRKIAERKESRTNSYFINLTKYWYVACLFVVGLVSVLVYHESLLPIEYYSVRENKDLEWFENKSQRSKTIELLDGSVVYLLPQSSIGIEKGYNQEIRNVTLKGSAFFEVQSDSSKPFQVHTQHIVTKVYGTSFWIRSNEQYDSIAVAVLTGKVSVKKISYASQANEIFIRPNQQIIMVAEGDHQIKDFDSKKPVYAAYEQEEENQAVQFNNVFLSEVLAELQESSGKTIVYDEARFANCRLTASFTGESFFEKLDLICLAIQAEYQFFDEQIFLLGKGCQPQ